MSYILEALKKAESERERGEVPGLSSTQTNTTTYIRYRSGTPGWWVVLALGALLAVVAGLWVWRQPVADVPAALPVSQAAAPVPVSASVPAPAPAPAAVPVAAPVAPSPSGAAVAASRVAPVIAKTPVASPIAAIPPEPPAKPLAAANPAPNNSPRSASTGIPLYSELPDSLRRQMPALAISGAIYSDSPAEWTLIINDQVLGKGSQVAPDLRLEDISATSATFNFKGQRFRMER